MSVYIIAGASSNLASALLPLLLQSGATIYATHNTGTDIPTNVTYITRDEAVRMARARELSCAMWLAPVDDVEAISLFVKHVPTLAISSMAIAQHMLQAERGDVSKLNAYQKGKLAMFSVPGLYSIAPGFFIDDCEEQQQDVISPGLHGDTMRELMRPLGAPFINAKFTLDKPPMSVTLKSRLASVLAAWAAAPTELLKPNIFTVLCTDGEYSRAQLRLLALGDYVPPPANVYKHLAHPVGQRVEHAEVATALRSGYLKRQKTEKGL